MTQLEKDLHNFIRNALNRTITKAQKEQIKLLQQDFNLPSTKIRRLSRTKRANMKSLSASIYSLKTPLSINNFKARRTKQGVSVRIKKGASTTITGALLMHSKKHNRTFIAHTKPVGAPQGFSTRKTRQNHKRPFYYFNIPSFSAVALKKSQKLQAFSAKTFAQELDKE